MNNTSKIIAVVAVIIVVAAAAFMVLGGDNEKSEGDKNKDALAPVLQKMSDDTADYPARLMILGNANCDDDIDDKDVAYIEKLIKNGYDYTKEFMADANYDGVIDEKDVELVKQLIDKNNYKGKVNYLNCNYKIRQYDMGVPLKLANILTQTLEIECILAPEAIVATDFRAAQPSAGGQSTFWTEFASVIDYSKLGMTGSHKTPNAETYEQIARQYGDGYLTVWYNSEYANNTGYLEDSLKGSNVQIIRLPSWENGSTANGVLTAGYMFHKYDRAVEWVAWYDGWMDKILEKVNQLTPDQKKKVLGSYLSTSEEAPEGEYMIFKGDSGEYQNLLKLGIIDLVEKISLSGSKSWKEVMTDEQFANLCKTHGCDLMVGTVAGPFGAVGKDPISVDYIKKVYEERLKGINEYADGKVNLVVFGWIFASGPMELTFLSAIGNHLYGWDLPVEQITNEGLKWVGNYGTGNYQYTYDSIKDLLFYTGA